MGRKYPYFDGCMPIEVMALRGHDTLRWGPMKPVGLPMRMTSRGHMRSSNCVRIIRLALYNMVGFQTKRKIYRKFDIQNNTGLEQAEFARLGGLHRNTFINARVFLMKNCALNLDQIYVLLGKSLG